MDKFPDRTLAAMRTGKLSIVVLPSKAAVSNLLKTDMVAVPSTVLSSDTKRPVEVTVISIITKDPIAAVTTGIWRSRIDVHRRTR